MRTLVLTRNILESFPDLLVLEGLPIHKPVGIITWTPQAEHQATQGAKPTPKRPAPCSHKPLRSCPGTSYQQLVTVPHPVGHVANCEQLWPHPPEGWQQSQKTGLSSQLGLAKPHLPVNPQYLSTPQHNDTNNTYRVHPESILALLTIKQCATEPYRTSK